MHGRVMKTIVVCATAVALGGCTALRTPAQMNAQPVGWPVVVDPQAEYETLFEHRGFVGFRYEYYGWHYFQRPADPAALAGVQPGMLSEPIEFLYSFEGCSGYRFEYYGWHPFVLCGGAQPPGDDQRPSQLSYPVEFLVEIEGCSVYRFEYYGWHYYARCDGQLSGRPSLLTEPVEFLFEHDGCRGYRFEYYGWHNLTVCDDAVGASRIGQLEYAVELVHFDNVCRAYRFEYYGWHDVVKCTGMPASYTTTGFHCGENCWYEETVQTIALPWQAWAPPVVGHAAAGSSCGHPVAHRERRSGCHPSRTLG